MGIELPGYRLTGPVHTVRARWPAGEEGGISGSDDDGDDGPAPPAAVPEPGQAAVIRRGVRLADDRRVAVKLFSAADRARAERESDLGHAVEHPNLLAPLEVVGTAEAVGLILPWAAGGSLETLVSARRRLRWPEALTVLIALADALAAIHERDIVHGDVSAGNVLLDAQGRPLLADLGAARAATESGVPVSVTPTDVAPEIVRGAAPSPAADVFGMGSVALRCVSGCPAWPARDLDDVLAQSAAGQWPDPGDQLAPAPLTGLIRRLLDPEPERRGSAAELAVELRGIGRPEPVALLERRADGTILAPAPATVVRADAIRPPRVADGVVLPSSAGWRGRVKELAGRYGRAVAIASVVVVLGTGAIRMGLWWAGWGQADPARAAPAAVPSRGAPTGRPAPTTDAADRSSTASAAPSPTALSGASPTVPAVASSPAVFPASSRRAPVSAAVDAGASDPDWLAVVARLDEARSRALMDRDPSLLSEVYTRGAAARAADAEQIGAMRSAGYHVRDAAHRLRSAALVDVGDQGAATVRVVESLPAHPVYGAGGEVVGHTAEVEETAIIVELVPAADGFRISSVQAE